MSSAGFILAINFCVAGIFALVFLLISRHNRDYLSARWFAAAYTLGMVTVALEFSLPLLPEFEFLLSFGIAMAFLSALMCFLVGVARRYDVPPPIWAMLALFVLSGLSYAYIDTLPRDSLTRMFGYQLPYFILQIMGAWIAFRYGRRRYLEISLSVFLGLSAFNYITKPFLAMALGGTGASPILYIHTTYALYSQTIGAVLAISVGVLFIIVYMRDMLAVMRVESETDRLSGLLNRRGFEAGVKTLLEKREIDQVPATMIVCDLDHFKMINDAHGHAVGDMVIESFADLLATCAAEDSVVGRIGGEEFALFLPATNGAMAKLFAENVRCAYAETTIGPLPRNWHLTASFGVAEMVDDETFGDLLRRADLALYEAKGAGRNQVCVALRIYPEVKGQVFG